MRAAPDSAQRRSRKTLGLVLLSYVALTVASLYPQSLSPSDTVGYIGDSLDTVYFMAWNARQAFRDPLHLFDANLLHPQRESMALAGHRILPGVLSAPVGWLTGNPILAYNLVLFAVYVATALTGRHLARLLGVDAVGSWAAGALYAFNTYQVNEAPRADLLFHFLSALALAELVRLLRGDGARHAWRLAGLMVLQGLASNYLLLYGALLLALVLAATLVIRPLVVLRQLPALALATAAAVVCFLPVILPHVRSSRELGFAREAPRGIDVQHYVSTLPTNLVYGAIGARVRPQQFGPHFVGFVPLLLAVVAVVAQRRLPAGSLLPPRIWVPAALLLLLVLVALTLGRHMDVFGHHLGPGPYRLLHALPGFAYIRIPERLAFFALLFLALLAGAGLTLVRGRLGFWPAAILAACVPLEHLSPLPLTERMPVGADVPRVYRWLATDTASAVVEVPVPGEGLVRKETVEEYFSTYHWKPIVHGYVSYPPLLTTLLRRAALDFPSAASLQVLARVGVDTVVVHEGRPDGVDLERGVASAVAAGALQRLARFDGEAGRAYEGRADAVYRISPLQPLAAAPLPSGRQVTGPAWTYHSPQGAASAIGDGDPRTYWSVPGELEASDTLEIHFPAPLQVTGVRIPLDRSSAFPTLLRIEGRNEDGTWRRLARLDGPHVLQLVDQLRDHPGHATLGFDLEGRGGVSGLRLLMGEGARGFEGWNLSEIEVLAP